MTLQEALDVFEMARFWKISHGGCMISSLNGKWVRAIVRRKQGETLSEMIVRCAEVAGQRMVTGIPKPRKPGPKAAARLAAKSVGVGTEMAQRRAIRAIKSGKDFGRAN